MASRRADRMSAKRVVIVGGGYAGTLLARSLDDVADVTLIEPRTRFVHNVAAIRAVVEPQLLARLLIPFDRLLKRGTVVHATATQISPGAVTLSDGRVVSGDIVVVATGSHYAAPFKPQDSSIEAFVRASRSANEAVAKARSVAIIGAGAVGIELAGEIATACPKKTVTLVSSTSTLAPAYPAKLGKLLTRQLKAKGVSLIAGATARNLPGDQRPFGPATIDLSSGATISADAVFPVIGSRPETNLLRSIAGLTFDRLGRVKTDPWLRLPGHTATFAVGDVADIGDLMTIVAISRQVPWLVKAIKRVLAGAKLEGMPTYTPWSSPPILLPLGPHDGASVLPFFGKGLVVGRRLTSRIKGRDLFIPRYRRDFGHPK